MRPRVRRLPGFGPHLCTALFFFKLCRGTYVTSPFCFISECWIELQVLRIRPEINAVAVTVRVSGVTINNLQVMTSL